MILITGIGRCGTSALARVIHENTHICMGHTFPPKDQWNPKGYFECARSFEIIRNSFDVETDLSLFHASHGCGKNEWGIKHQKLCELDITNLEIINPDFIIVCTRAKEDIIKSRMTFKAEKTRKDCEAFYERRQVHIDRIMRSNFNIRTLDFTHFKTDEEILRDLEAACGQY